MEQLVARRAHNPKATGSSPVPATKENLSQKTQVFYWLKLKQAEGLNEGKVNKKRSCVATWFSLLSPPQGPSETK